MMKHLSGSLNGPTYASMTIAMIVFGLISLNAYSDEFSPPSLTHSQSDFGGVGLIQMPSGRMMSEGAFELNATNNDDYINYSLSLQLFPWLETTIRYTQIHDLLYSNDASFSGDTKYTDKSADVKLSLVDEGFWLPQISVGFRDIGGTGLFDGEFIAANKQFGPLDFTLGIGWGYIGNRGNLSGDHRTSTDCGRSTGYQATTGSISLGSMFTGCASVYGGIEYQTPFEPLVLKLEYDGNDYRSDFPVTQGKQTMNVSTPWNVGLVYSLTDWARLRLSYERGNTFTAGISLNTNLATLRPVWIDEPRPEYHPQPKKNTLSEDEWQQLVTDVQKIAGYQQVSFRQDQKSKTVTLTGTQQKYRNKKEAEERAALLITNSGLDADTYKIVETANGQPLTETQINAYAFERVVKNDYPGADFDDAKTTGEPSVISGEMKAQSSKNWQFGLTPALQQSFGGSENFYLYAIGVKANSSYRMGQHFILSSSLYGNITDNYDKYKYTVPPDGTDLKRVRTLARQYYDHTFRMDSLQLTYLDHYGDNVYGQAYGGYLESMFAGAGGEIIYRPLNQNWAFGIDGNYVKQRDPDSVLGLYKDERHFDPQTARYYRVQTGTFTGHATLYWQPKFWSLFNNTLLKISAGQYLTEDKGVTVDFSKQFDSGVIAGVFAAKTNLSASEYGEGSFTKGVYISIPLDLMTIKPSVHRANISWLPLMRDGGQKLNRQYELYNMTDARSPWFTKSITE
ncbi:YjbH domain-containing protein [Vibrio sp. MEBiC08052]|uniref:YjbH domain-containing protein n=1 Tax=Vibrio sp. MEBiC08052 TaxID=1761910 RepID=UPI000740779B|nr:WbfB [Vibrio sp. MEBiC08052]